MAPGHGRFFELVEWHHLVYEAHIQGFLGIVLVAEKPDFAGFFLAHHAGQVAGSKAAVKGTHVGAGLAEAGVVGGNAQVAHHVQHVAAADGPARHHRNDRLGNGADDFLEFQHVEAGHGVFAHVAAVAAHALVAARAEGPAALAGEDNHADVGAVLAQAHGLNHLLHREGREGVVDLRAVDADFGNAAVLGKQDFLEFLDGGPGYWFGHERKVLRG